MCLCGWTDLHDDLKCRSNLNGVSQELQIQMALQVKSFPVEWQCGFRTLARKVFFTVFCSFLFMFYLYLMIKKVGRVSISYSIKQLLSLQVVRDYVNTRWYFTSKARVASQHHLSINLDLFNPITLHSTWAILPPADQALVPSTAVRGPLGAANRLYMRLEMGVESANCLIRR